MILQRSVAAVMAWLVMGLSGCAMYSETRDAQGKAAKESWAKVDLGAQTSIARKNLTQLYELQLTTEDQSRDLRQDALVRALAQSYGKPMQGALVDLQSALGIVPGMYPCTVAPIAANAPAAPCSFQPTFASWREHRDRELLQQDMWVSLDALVTRFVGTPLPSCAGWTSQPTVQASWTKQFETSKELRAAVPGGVNRVSAICDELIKAQSARIDLVKGIAPNSAWPMELARALTEQKALDDLRAQALAVAAEVRAAKKALEEAEDADDLSRLDEVKKAAERLEMAVAQLKALADLAPGNPILKDMLLDAKQDSLNAFLKTVKDAKPGEDPPAASGRAATAVVLFANFFDSTSKRLKKAEEFGLAGLVLERRLAEIEQARVQRAIQVQQQRISLTKARAAVAEDQLHAYMTADAHWSKLPAEVMRMPVHQALLGDGVSAPGPTVREDLWTALGIYLDAGTRLDAAMHKLALQQISLDRMEAVSASETSLQSWAALIGSNVDQLAAWSASGVRKEHLSQLVNGVSAVFIAYGVNK